MFKRHKVNEYNHLVHSQPVFSAPKPVFPGASAGELAWLCFQNCNERIETSLTNNRISGE